MTGSPPPLPRFLSWQFHIAFFPAVLARRLRPRRKPQGFQSPFAHHIALEFPLMLVVCLVLAAVGLPNALAGGSVLGWIVGGLGTLGALALVAQSIGAQLGTPPTFEAFSVGVFAFFLIVGPTLGFVLGAGHHSRALEVAGAVVGLVAGYAVGIAAGLWVQYLGWIAPWVEMAAALGALGTFVTDLVLIFG